jgi:hypothetical protein
MDKELEERIRERAYELWMRHGSLPGQADEYWSMTVDETLSSPAVPKTRKKRSPVAAPEGGETPVEAPKRRRSTRVT